MTKKERLIIIEKYILNVANIEIMTRQFLKEEINQLDIDSLIWIEERIKQLNS